MPDFLNLHIRVKALSASLEADDDGVPGTYLVRVNGDLPPGQQVGCALDAFHEHVGIRSLEDFDICVMNPRTYEIMDEDEDHESYSAAHGDAEYVEKIMDGIEGTAFSVTLAAVNIDNPRDRVDLGSAALVAENIDQVQQRALDLMWDTRLDSASCQPHYGITHATEEIPLPGHLFWWSDIHGNHRAKTPEHEYLVAASTRDEGIFNAYIDDRHEACRKSVADTKAFCRDIHSGKLKKRPISRP
jgi:hypothetical protein